MKAKRILGHLLISFVLVTIGFALGKEYARTPPAVQDETPTASPAAMGEQVIVYYMHQTFRCVTCNKIEAMTEDLVKTDFAGALQSGRLQFRRADFQEDEALARRYNVASSSVVVVRERDGKDVAFKRLDDVWTQVDKPAEFRAYVGGVLREYLGGEAP
jgi:hypothetical protein